MVFDDIILESSRVVVEGGSVKVEWTGWLVGPIVVVVIIVFPSSSRAVVVVEGASDIMATSAQFQNLDKGGE